MCFRPSDFNLLIDLDIYYKELLSLIEPKASSFLVVFLEN